MRLRHPFRTCSSMFLISSMFSSLPALAQTSAWGKGNFSEEFMSFRKGIMTSDIDEEATLCGRGTTEHWEGAKQATQP